MGVSISYATTEAVSSPVRAAILAEANRRNGEHTWWCENLVFIDDPERPKHLVGDTKLYLPGYSLREGGFVDVDPDDDSFMAHRDALFIVGLLHAWAREYGLAWQVSVLEPIGLVGPDGPDESLEAFLALMASEALSETPNDLFSEQRAAQINAKYASRDDESA